MSKGLHTVLNSKFPPSQIAIDSLATDLHATRKVVKLLKRYRDFNHKTDDYKCKILGGECVPVLDDVSIVMNETQWPNFEFSQLIVSHEVTVVKQPFSPACNIDIDVSLESLENSIYALRPLTNEELIKYVNDLEEHLIVAPGTCSPVEWRILTDCVEAIEKAAQKKIRRLGNLLRYLVRHKLQIVKRDTYNFYRRLLRFLLKNMDANIGDDELFTVSKQFSFIFKFRCYVNRPRVYQLYGQPDRC